MATDQLRGTIEASLTQQGKKQQCDTQQRDTQQRDTQQRDTQQRDTQQRDTQQRDTQQRDTQQRDESGAVNGAGFGRQMTSRLRADPCHPFFFDHKLDHVPGIWTVNALLDLLRQAVGPGWAGWQLRLHMSFPQFCELDGEVELHCVPGPDGQWLLRANQDGAVICEGTARLCPQVAGQHRVRPTSEDSVVPAEGKLVHRLDPGNIMAGELVPQGTDGFEAAVLSSPAFPEATGPRRAVELIESARQLSLMLGHVAYARSFESQTVWLTMEADVPVTLRRETPLAFQWRTAPKNGAEVRFAFDLVGAAGSVTIVSRAVSRAVYQRLRAAAAAEGPATAAAAAPAEARATAEGPATAAAADPVAAAAEGPAAAVAEAPARRVG
jgi:hypothetical protein